MELYKKYRPTKFKEVVGQEAVVNQLTAMGKAGEIPHTILFTGPSGCGKTTLARILRHKLKCADVDFIEKNASEHRGIDMVREINGQIGGAALGGPCRVWLIDECHAMTSDAQSAFLKLLEDTPAHVYFFLATTDPQKLKNTIITRCTELKCKSISEIDLATLIAYILDDEGKVLSEEVIDRITSAADGSARKALVILDSVIKQEGTTHQLAAIEAADYRGQAIEICRALLNKGTDWKKMAGILQGVEEEPEAIRRMVLGYARTVLLRSGDARAALIIEEFRDNWYDSLKAGLAVSCYNIIRG